MTVSAIMNTTVHMVHMDDTVGDVARLMERVRFDHVLVMDDGVLVGILSDRDIKKALSPYSGTQRESDRDEALRNRRVHLIMTRHPITVGPDTDTEFAARQMLDSGVSCLPVVDRYGDVAGMLSWRDLLSHYMQAALRHEPIQNRS